MTRQPRRRLRQVIFGTLLLAGLCGLGIAAVGTAHQLEPRRFTPAQQRKIEAWEMTRRWRAQTAGEIFPAAVSYRLPGQVFDTGGGLTLSASRLTIATSTSCTGSLSKTAARILASHGCAAVLRATYLDATGSLVATVGVAVLPDSGAALAAARDLGADPSAEPLRALPVGRTLASAFRNPQRQLSKVSAAGPYVIFSTAGFTDGRGRVGISADGYLNDELTSLATGLSASASSILGRQPPVPACPGAPGC
jgi:hypothetical protein